MSDSSSCSSDKRSFSARVSPGTPSDLAKLAMALGYVYGKGAAMGKFLDDIAQRKLVVIPEDVWRDVTQK
ncbi:MAG: hypothetical protein AAGB13_10425 [Cyanobacteria bacterium P01_F01_bin.33]